MRLPLMTIGATLGVAGLLLTAAPGLASDPPSQDATAPSGEGDRVTAEWTGTVLPGGNPDSSCANDPTADTHTIELTVPEGVQTDALLVLMTATITPTGENADASDVIVTLVHPDGTTQSGDGGFTGVAESTSVARPVSGTYEVLACAFANALPQTYDGTLTLELLRVPLADQPACTAPGQSLKFQQAYVDESRAGGEPIMTTHPDGHLLWGSHAGTTHFYTPTSPSPTSGAFVENYEGQTYQYVSEDGATWEFVPRTPVSAEAPVAGVPASGFSDPEFAIDQAGNVFISEINLANISVYKSTDGGRSYGVQNFFAFTQSDRQWMAADREDELYMTANGFGGGPFPNEPAGNLGHFVAKSTDGGVTWNGASTTNPDGVGDIQIDHDRGILYELTATTDGVVGMARFPNIREEMDDFTVENFTIAEDVGLTGVQRLIDPTFDMDDDGNLYAVWYDNGEGLRPQGVYYSYSTDRAATWAVPVRVDPSPEDEVWPWISVGAPGQVAIAWLQTDVDVDAPLPGEAGAGSTGERLQEQPDRPWNVHVAHTGTGLGCADSTVPGFAHVTASAEPVHTGTICQHGTTCQTDLTDRRLGDYFAVEVDDAGLVNIAVSDTRQGGAVALPLHIRQVDGPALTGPPPPAATVDPPEPHAAPAEDAGPSMPATGGGMALIGLGLALGIAAVRRRG